MADKDDEAVETTVPTLVLVILVEDDIPCTTLGELLEARNNAALHLQLEDQDLLTAARAMTRSPQPVWLLENQSAF